MNHGKDWDPDSVQGFLALYRTALAVCDGDDKRARVLVERWYQGREQGEQGRRGVSRD